MRYPTVLTLLFLSMLMPLCAQWDANGQAQLRVRSNIDVVNEGPSIFTSRVVVDRYDRIVTVRLGQRVPDTFFSIVIERLLPNGEHDPSFGDQGVAVIPFGTVQHDRLHGVFVDSMGAIVVVANVGPTPFFARVLANGRLDSTYGTNGIVRLDPTFTCGKENGVANGHNVSIACSKVIDDTTTRCLLVHVSDRGIVSYEPYISSRCSHFMVYHHGEQYLASGRTVIKLDTNGLIDTTFGSFGSFRWRHLGGEAFTDDMELYDDTTIAVLTHEYSPGTAVNESEYVIWYLNVDSGRLIDSVVIPFGYLDDPRLRLFYLVVDGQGAVSVGGSYIGQQTSSYPTTFKFSRRSIPDASFYGTGRYDLALPFESVLIDIATLATTQVVAFVWPSILVRLGDPVTSVRETTAPTSFSIVPNPTEDCFTIRAPYPIAGIRYEIVSMLGAVVQEGQTDPEGRVVIAGVLERGSYIVRIYGPSHEVTGALLQVR
ncbi:MAG: T9SS type A sorting domain-containing protein [Bacteroidetes bacterium]|nr:T9SS type A sorting domain-containing protein [Bacteroidota bacterium]